MHNAYKLLFRIIIGCLIPREGCSNQISWDHKHFIWFLVNHERLDLDAYIFNNLCDAIKGRQKYNKKIVPYARLLSELFHQSRFIHALKKVSATRDLEETYGNILSTVVLRKMNIIKKKDVVKPEESLSLKSGKTTYLEDFPFISKLENLEIIQEFIKMTREDIDIILTMDDIPYALENAYKPSRKRKWDAFGKSEGGSKATQEKGLCRCS